jgi:hypothetical protein
MEFATIEGTGSPSFSLTEEAPNHTQKGLAGA